MPTDLMIYTLHDLAGLIRRGIIVPLGGQRYRFTRDHKVQTVYNHPTKTYLDPIVTPSFSVTAGTIFNLLDMSSPERTVQHPSQQVFSIMFELGSANRAYYGNTQYYTAGEGAQSHVHDITAPTSVTVDDKKYYVGGQKIGLRGRGSDAEGTVTFSWSQVAGPVVTIINSDKQDAWCVAPYVFQATTLQFRFTVNDGVQTATADLYIQVKP